MPTHVLIVTVGGSCAPVVTAVRHHDHEVAHVYFICSSTRPGQPGSRATVDGPGAPCGKDPATGKDLPNIVAQAGLSPARFQVFETADPDDLAASYTAVEEAYAAALALDPRVRIRADYTGGTKTMSAALLRAATGRHAARTDLFVTTGPRDRLSTVRLGMEAAQSQDARAIVLEEPWHEALRLANAYHYAAAAVILQQLLAHQPPPPPALRRRTQRLLALCRGFDAWDRFAHDHAHAALQPEAALLSRVAPDLMGNARTLADLAHEQGDGAGRARGVDVPQAGARAWDARGVVAVDDLLRNAERRAAQGRYDDAVARLYRALELLAQARLHGAFGIDTGKVDPSTVTEWLAAHPDRAQRTPIRTGLRDDYEILRSKHDPLGAVHAAYEGRLQMVLNRRNASILAHGLIPISHAEYEPLLAPVREFVDAGIAATGLRLRPVPQFPTLLATHFD